MNGADLLRSARDQRVVPLFYESDAALAADVVVGLAEGGARLIEFTLRGPRAELVLARLVDTAPSGVVVGAGSVRNVQQARLALDAGAAFVVGPNGDADVATLCADHGIGYVPGSLTPSEIVTALSWGCDLIKVFPATAVGGATFVGAVRGPLPDVQLMATGGIGIADVRSYLAAGAACVGLGGELVRTSWVAAGDVAALAAAMRSVLVEAGVTREG